MKKKIVDITRNYLQNKINQDNFIQSSKEIYETLVRSATKDIPLDSIIWIPFFHEFAYCRYTDSEMKLQVAFFCELLNGKRYYQYSSFFKVSLPDVSDKLMYDLYINFGSVSMTDLYDLFVSRIEIPLTLKDILYNLIYDILSKTDFTNQGESEFDYVNCEEDVSCHCIREKIMNLLSYYLGINPFYVDINFFSNGNVVYTIS